MNTQFYQLTLDRAIAKYEAGLMSSVGLLYDYFCIRFKPGWHISIDPDKICQQLKLTKDQFYRGFRKIKLAFPEFKINIIPTSTRLDGFIEETAATDGETPTATEKTPTSDGENTTRYEKSATYYEKSATGDRETPNKTRQHSDSPNYSSDSSSNSSHSFSKEGEPEKKEKEKKKKENTNTGINQATSNRKESQNDNSILVNNLNPVEDKSSAAAHNSQAILPKSDVVNKSETALDVNRPLPQTQKEKQFNWVPAGPWCDENNKLNPQFVEWLARDWQKAYGGDLHRKKADVLRHFVKNPANIAISWQQYQSEYLHRYQNASVRMQHGLEIKPDEQQQLLSNHAAVTKPLPEQMNPVACQLPVTSDQLPDKQLPVASDQLPVESKQSLIETEQLPSDTEEMVTGHCSLVTENKQFSSDSKTLTTDDQSLISKEVTGHCSLVTEEVTEKVPEGADNPDAYKLFVPNPIEEEKLATPEQFKDFKQMLSGLKKNLSMPKAPTPVKEASELEKLNEWLADPVLKAEAIARAKANGYGIDYSDYGEPIRIVDLEF